MSETLDITPDTHFLNSIRSDRGSYTAMLAEGIDNSFDAGATEVAITLIKDLIAIEDNGIGITKERESAIVRLGEHGPMVTTMLGVFGIGIKYHAVSAGNLLEVDSVSVDGRMKLNANWDRVIHDGKWQIPKPMWIQALPTASTGTRVYIRSLRWLSPTTKDAETARDQLAQIFYPAITANKIILLNETPIPALREPELTHTVEGEIRLANGKGARVRGGIMVNPGKLHGVQVSYKHRVIMPKSTFGCGSYGGLRKLFARVDLMGAWTLARFKNSLADNDATELEDAVQELLRPVLEECHSEKMSADIDEMAQLLNEMLPPELVPARPPKKPKKPKPEPEEEIEKKKKRKRKLHNEIKEAEETPRGPARKRKANEELIIDFDKPVVEEHGYGHFIPGRPGRIILAQDNPHIADLINMRDKSVAKQSLYALALMIYLHARDTQPGQQEIPYDGPFGLRAWNLVKRQPVADESAA